MAQRRPPIQHEARFVKDFSTVCSYSRMLLVDIPDAIIFRGQKTITEKQRPADAVLITPNALFLIEFKANRGQQSYHQKLKEKHYTSINRSSYYVVRRNNKIDRKTGKTCYVYTVEQDNQKLFQSTDIVELVNYFKRKRC